MSPVPYRQVLIPFPQPDVGQTAQARHRRPDPSHQPQDHLSLTPLPPTTKTFFPTTVYDLPSRTLYLFISLPICISAPRRILYLPAPHSPFLSSIWSSFSPPPTHLHNNHNHSFFAHITSAASSFLDRFTFNHHIDPTQENSFSSLFFQPHPWIDRYLFLPATLSLSSRTRASTTHIRSSHSFYRSSSLFAQVRCLRVHCDWPSATPPPASSPSRGCQ